MQPSEIKELPSARSLLYADGYSDGELNKPIIAVVNSKNDIVPGHIHLDKLASKVKQGIREAGGTQTLPAFRHLAIPSQHDLLWSHAYLLTGLLQNALRGVQCA